MSLRVYLTRDDSSVPKRGRGQEGDRWYWESSVDLPDPTFHLPFDPMLAIEMNARITIDVIAGFVPEGEYLTDNDNVEIMVRTRKTHTTEGWTYHQDIHILGPSIESISEAISALRADKLTPETTWSDGKPSPEELVGALEGSEE